MYSPCVVTGLILCVQQTAAFIAPVSLPGRLAPVRAVASRVGYAPTDVQGVWDNHFAAFGGKDMEKILLDYDESSVITTFDQTTDKKEVFEGLEGARKLFEGLFEALSDQSDLAAPMVQVDEAARLIFLIWRCPASGFLDATDTFLINDTTKKISRQNVAFRTG